MNPQLRELADSLTLQKQKRELLELESQRKKMLMQY
jgi:hypothetical protein